jgi:hypothetical protein
LNKGVLFYQRSDGGYAPVPTPESQLMATNHPEKSLLFFYMLLSVLLNQASMRSFNIKAYLHNIDF